MDDFKYVVGIDVAKDSLAFSVFDGKKHHFDEIEYTSSKITRSFVRPFQDNKKEVLFICESTGVYHLRLVMQLYNLGFNISVVNPFAIKKYAEMKMMRAKTDAVDARLIAAYGAYEDEIHLFEPKSEVVIAIDNLLKAIDDLRSQKTMVTNQHHALKHQVQSSKVAIASYKRHITFIEKEIACLEQELETIIIVNFKEEYRLLRTIPGIGLKSSGVILGIYNAFKTFDNAKQACAFAGICPSPHQSGTSVNGRGSISKRGNSFARKTLYMASLSAIQYNPFAKAQYERLVANGKSKNKH
ncbi:MAG: IS110 family transposase [Thiovulaceae bacterium]|nr:IS110 family transposase [Sulfurimonadaceae bacterium]